jgi:hypothetical protein
MSLSASQQRRLRAARPKPVSAEDFFIPPIFGIDDNDTLLRKLFRLAMPWKTGNHAVLFQADARRSCLRSSRP